MSRKYRNLFERLIAHCVMGPRGCWLWMGHRDDKGYGKLTVRIEGKPQGFRAHRVMWMLLKGPIPEGLHLDHLADRCDGASCINPEHMEAVTPKENTARMWFKRRAGSGPLPPEVLRLLAPPSDVPALPALHHSA